MSTHNKLFALLMLVLVIGFLSVFTVKQTEKAIKFRLGEIVRSDYEPGLHFMMPIINNVKTFDARILTLDSRPERFLTSEKKNVIVDSFVKWRIGDVTLYYTTVAGDALQANLRLDQIMKDAMRSEFGRRTIKELVSEDRAKMRDLLIASTEPVAKALGVDLVDIRIKRIDLPSEVSSSVYRRMEAERGRVAREFRSQGAEAAERIRADADKQREILLAEAFRKAETTRGEGDAIAADVYAKAFGKDIDFFAFHRSLNAYKKTFRGHNDMLVLEPDSDFFKYFNQME